MLLRVVDAPEAIAAIAKKNMYSVSLLQTFAYCFLIAYQLEKYEEYTKFSIYI
ncbi:MAG: hypothetical protein V7K48_16440 [Nostoc sp.]|uniref:hypothetical protein n=1 Tax=Nostoc sp. TaxID=1180 RepID=UPI002FF4B930